ncbi:MAG TPA: hypothetical protein VG818_03270 [Gemmatimonadaceae bacterium]|jgi:hypothetical protein|nr:hypothetical protein [Gemmatimonadaceae bacterium]
MPLRIHPRLAAALLAAALLTPLRADAQLGGLLKKAKDKVEQKQQENSSARPSDAFGPALTEESLPAVLKGLAVTNDLLTQRDGIQKQRDAVNQRRSTLLSAHEAERDAWERAQDATSSCISTVLEKVNQKHQAEMQARLPALMADQAKFQAFQQANMKMSQELMAAQAKHDTAGINAIMSRFYKDQFGIDVKADSASAQSQCGKLAPKPAWMIQVEAQSDTVDKLDTQMRDLESRAEAQGAVASGMDAVKFAMARERLVNWLDGRKRGHYVQQFSSDEIKLFERHQAEIEKVSRAL